MITRVLFFGAVALLVSSQSHSQEVIVEDSEGGIHTFIVSAEDSFERIVETISNEIETIQGAGSYQKSIRLHLPHKGYHFAVDLARKPRKEQRNYAMGISATEGSDIGYIVKTLSNSSLAKIKSNESSLKRAGDRIDAVHPLQFLTHVFLNEELKVAVRNLQGRSWVWKDFLEGLTDTLAEENRKNNILPYLDDFAKRLHVDVNMLLPFQQSDRWERFVNTLIDVIPRQEGRDRYNQ